MVNFFLKIGLVCIIIVAHAYSYAWAQNCNNLIFGTIKDAKTKEILPGASVAIKEIGAFLVVDDDSHYHFNQLCNGNTYTLQINFLGYQQKEILVQIKKTATEINVLLNPLNSQLAEVNVQAKGGINKLLQTQSQLKGKELELSRGLSLGEALKTIPGLSAIQTGPTISKPVIHGLHANRILIYNNGVRLEGQQWGSEHAPEIDPFIANQITVVKGAASVLYGSDAMGGVVLVEPSALAFNKKLTGQVNLVAISNNGQGAVATMLESAVGKNANFCWRLQTTYKIAGNAKTPNYYIKNTGFNERNAALTLGYRQNKLNTELFASTFNTKLGIFTGAHIGSITDLLNAIDNEKPDPSNQSNLNYKIGRPYQNVSHNLIKLKINYPVGDFGILHAQYSNQQNNREEYDVVRGSADKGYQLKFDLNTQNAELILDHTIYKNLQGKVGLQGMFQQNYYDGRYLIPFFTSYNGGIFLIEKYTKNKLSLEGGLRYDNKYMQARLRQNVLDDNSPEIQPQFNFDQVSATFGTGYQILPHLKWTSTLAKAWRPPAINELFSFGVHHGSGSFEKGDKNLSEESSINFTSGLTKTNGKLTGEISAYINHINNYIYLKPDLKPVLTVRGAFPSFTYVQVNARFTGADFLTQYQFNKFFKTSVKYSFVRAYNLANNNHLEFIPPDKASLIIQASLNDSKKIKNTSIDITINHFAKQWRVKREQDYAPTPNAATVLNIDLSSQLILGKNSFNLSLSCINALNTPYRDYLNRFRYYADETGRNFILRLQIPIGKGLPSKI
ncbi:MAG: TonB-dependent receptor [Sphingobacteriales bacterium]|nr:MAG: TonB-dependent receptor [Sphingobacteriales bacterium]TAF78756.1 MAG: TonB-dependent receptor [Sphingobacteriales bacterium]